jgi:hypothetical protein
VGLFSDLRGKVAGKVASVFIPPYLPAPYRSAYADEPERIRLERPLQTHSIQRFYQADIEDALHMADAGDLTLVAQLSRALRRDGVAGGLLSTRASGLTRLPKLFRGTASAVEALENREGRTGLFDRIFPPKELALWIGDGILNGVRFGELVPLPDRPEPVFVRIDPQFLRYVWGDNRWYYRSVGGLIHVVPGDGRWVLGFPGGIQNPWQNGLWSSLSRSYVSKDHSFHYREAYMATLANAARVAEGPLGATEDEREGWAQKLMAWGLNSVFSLPKGWTVKLLESNGIGYQAFKETIESCNYDMMIALAGQLVTVTGGVGFANADIFKTIALDLIQDDADGACGDLNEQALRPIVNNMLGSGERGTVEIDTTPPTDLTAVANSITAACEAVAAFNQQAAPYGFEVDLQEIVTRYRIPVRRVAPHAPPAAEPVSPDVSGKKPALSLVKGDVAQASAMAVAEVFAHWRAARERDSA